jgi:hypothetical protein
MKVELSRRDYRSLLTVLEIADWVLHGYRAEEPRESAAVRALEQKLLALAEEFGSGELVDYDAAEQRYVLSREFDETSEALEFIDEFENDCFWEQLTQRLVERDLARELGEDALKRLDPEELEERAEPYRTLYGEEFLSHGVDRLEILQHPIGGSSRTRLS